MSRVQSALKYIDSLPFSITIRHYFPFNDRTTLLKNGEISSSKAWDTLRQKHPNFSISENRVEWLKAAEAQVEKDGQDKGLVRRAKDVVEVIERLGVTKVFSAGVGGAGLEYQIKKLKPELYLTCSEYSPVAVGALKKVFTECDSVVFFDMNTGDWHLAIDKTQTREKQLCILSRIDIDLTNKQFRNIFKNMHAAGIRNVLVITCVDLTLYDLVSRMYHRILGHLRGVYYVFAGYLRSKRAFIDLWSPFYNHTELTCGGLKSFLLEIKNDTEK